jgi:hypothetical protein
MTEPNLSFVVIPASDDEACIVQGVHVGGWVEVTLSWAIRQRRRFRSDQYTPTRLLAVKRFRRSDIAGYTTFAGHLEDSARIAARGELGYYVHTAVQDGEVSVSLVARLLEPDGRIHTEISRDDRFAEADSMLALVQANENATELRALAEELTDRWTSAWDAQVSELRAEYDKNDAQARAAAELKRIVDSEGA